MGLSQKDSSSIVEKIPLLTYLNSNDPIILKDLMDFLSFLCSLDPKCIVLSSSQWNRIVSLLDPEHNLKFSKRILHFIQTICAHPENRKTYLKNNILRNILQFSQPFNFSFCETIFKLFILNEEVSVLNQQGFFFKKISISLKINWFFLKRRRNINSNVK